MELKLDAILLERIGLGGFETKRDPQDFVLWCVRSKLNSMALWDNECANKKQWTKDSCTH